MGGTSSSLSELGHNPLLQQLAGHQRIAPTESFWTELLSFHLLQHSYDDASESRLMEEQSMDLTQHLLRTSLHASSGGNAGSLLLVTIAALKNLIHSLRASSAAAVEQVNSPSSSTTTNKTSQIDEENIFTHASNALFILRLVVKTALEHCNALLASLGHECTAQARDLLLLRLFAVPTSPPLQQQEPQVASSSSSAAADTSKTPSSGEPCDIQTPSLPPTSTSIEATSAEATATTVDEKLKFMQKQTWEHFNELFGLLAEIVVIAPVNERTYRLHLEVVNNFLVFLSSTMFHPAWDHLTLSLSLLMNGKACTFSNAFVFKLLNNFIHQMETPRNLVKQTAKSSMVYNATTYLASSLWSVVTLGYGGGSGSSSTGVNDDVNNSTHVYSQHLLASQSVLLLLVLCNQCSSNSTSSTNNPYRKALFSYTGEEIIPTTTTKTTCLHQMLIVLSKIIHQDESAILLCYLLMHRNVAVRSQWLQIPQIDENLTLGLVSILYKSGGDNSHRVYMSLILLLMMTESDQFTANIHHKMLKRAPSWLTEMHSQTSEVSIGSVIVFVLVRTILCHLNQLKDKYLHTNCLAALANMSSRMANLHPIVCRRLMNLMRHLHRRHSRLVIKLQECAQQEKSNENDNSAAAAGGAEAVVNLNGKSLQETLMEEMSTVEETTRMLLEIINSILCHCINANPHFVYSMLCQHEASLVPFRSHPSFQDVVKNIESILGFFLIKLQKESQTTGDGRLDPTEQQVMEIIRAHSLTVSRHQGFRRFPELKFKYIEEDSPEEFFIPYVWSLVYQRSGMYFNPAKIHLFHWPSKQAGGGGGGGEDNNKSSTSSGSTINNDNVEVKT